MNLLLRTKPGLGSEDFLTHLTLACHKVALEFQKDNSLKDLKNQLWSAVLGVVHQDLFYIDSSHTFQHSSAETVELWSRKAVESEFKE